MVLAPTRELVIQIGESFQAYGRYTGLRRTVVYGGVGQNPQVRALQAGVDVLIATPGRLLDLMQQGFIDLSHVEILILDEGDRMLDMGFIHDLRRIVAKVPARRQTLLFSATIPPAIRQLADQWLTKPDRRPRQSDGADGRQDPAVGGLCRSGEQDPHAHALAAKHGLDADAGLHPHQASGRQGGQAPEEVGHRGRRLPCRQEPIDPAADPRPLQVAGPGGPRLPPTLPPAGWTSTWSRT